MTNSFPASELDVRYRVRLNHVPLTPKDGIVPSPAQGDPGRVRREESSARPKKKFSRPSIGVRRR